VGEAGIGKSRLRLEFRQRLGTDATWREGHAMAFGRAMAFHPATDFPHRSLRFKLFLRSPRGALHSPHVQRRVLCPTNPCTIAKSWIISA
jgi:hypothetical protein